MAVSNRKQLSHEQTPAGLGYRMPAEWHPHAATQLHWPGNRETWPGERLERVEEVYLNLIGVLHRFEPVLLLGSAQDLSRAEEKLKEREVDRSRVHLLEVPVNDVWARDCGPIMIRRETESGEEKYAVTDWEYNAWGGKYPPYDDDNRLPGWLAERFDFPCFRPGMVLEGGSIDVNGDGILMTTESVLLNPNRNPDLAREEIEQALQEYLGVESILWLRDGLAGDDTDGHIDDLARFLNPNTILASTTEDSSSVNYRALQENLEILRRSADVSGEPFEIVTLPLPETRIAGTTADGSEHVPASYANFYIANGVVLVPLYDKRFDEEALELFRNYFPGREIAGIPCADLVWGQGSIHCITRQLYGLPEL
ncbi:MAG: agmatine deiminase family protein [Balneolaceae bacterium]